MTHALLAGNIAINEANNNATATDQRGYQAVGFRDVGAFEHGSLEDVIFEDGFD